jgi:hypothetical protein
MMTALDHLGERNFLEEANRSAAAYLQALDQIAARVAGDGVAFGYAFRHGCLGNRLL